MEHVGHLDVALVDYLHAVVGEYLRLSGTVGISGNIGGYLNDGGVELLNGSSLLGSRL